MSYTEVFGFDKEGNAYGENEVKNAFRGAVAIWKILENKYLPEYLPSYAKDYGIRTADEFEVRFGYRPSRTAPTLSGDSPMKEIWGLADNKEVSEIDRICLFTTFDKCLVKKEDFQRVILAFREFKGETSLKEQADILENMVNDENCIAVGWNQTSVNCDIWESYGYDEEKDETIPYNCLKQDEHYWLFDELK